MDCSTFAAHASWPRKPAKTLLLGAALALLIGLALPVARIAERASLALVHRRLLALEAGHGRAARVARVGQRAGAPALARTHQAPRGFDRRRIKRALRLAALGLLVLLFAAAHVEELIPCCCG